MRFVLLLPAVALTALATAPGCSSQDNKQLTDGVAFETLQTEYWVASFETLKAELQKRGSRMVSNVADNDANRQFEQVSNFIARQVDGLIVVPKDAGSAVPMIRAANKANIPIVLYNRPPAETDGTYAA